MTLRLILGDQLNERHSWFQQPADPAIVYVLMEIRSETGYVRHHVQKVLAFFAAMRLFAERLEALGHRVRYLRFDDPANLHSFADNCSALIASEGIRRFEYLLPDEYRVDQHLRGFCQSLPIPWAVADTEHFLAAREDVAQQFAGKKTFLMESFYRKMRQKHRILMEDDGKTPLTGKVVQAAVDYWARHQDSVDMATLEGFVRQIIGWREYMRGIYWAKMPEFATLNYFDHQAPLPAWYWTGKTHMRCLSHAITQSLERGYAHHIQRLMVTGNFALLLGVHPDAVDAWYLGIYVDALEWVEITNTRGMSQFADGGLVGTKPYVSSAAYLHKMGDYCGQCHYRRDEKTGPRACPFNALYWDFYARHRPLLGKNPRIGMMYQVWDKMPAQERVALLERAEFLKKHADSL